MAFSFSTLPGTIGAGVVEDASANSTIQYDVTGGGASTLFSVYIDNTNNTGWVYLKFYDATSGVTVGTTANEMQFACPNGVSRQFNMPAGIAFATGMSYAMTTEAGTAGTTSPSSAVPIRLNATP